MTEPKYTLRDYGLLCERLFIDYSDCHKKSMIGDKSLSGHNLRLPPLKKDYILKNSSVFFNGKRDSNASNMNLHGSGQKILKETTPDRSKDNQISSNMEYSETANNNHFNSNLNTLQFNLEGTNEFTHQRNVFAQNDVHSDANTPLKMTIIL